MLSASEIELLRKTLKDETGDELIYARGLFIVNPIDSNLHFCEKVCLSFEDEKWCSAFLHLFYEDKKDPFDFLCPMGVMHFFVPLRCFNRHITNICVASRRIVDEPDIGKLACKKGAYTKRKEDREHFYNIPKLNDRVKIQKSQQDLLKALERAASKGVGSSIYLKDITYDLANRSTIDSLLEAIKNKAVELTSADRGCLFLQNNEKFERITPCEEFLNSRPCAVHEYEGFFKKILTTKQTVLLPKDHPEILEENKYSSLTAPLIIDNEVIGLIHVGSDDPNNFNDIHRERLIDLSKFAATAISSATSIQAKTVEAIKLETLYRIDSLMQDYTSEEYALFLFLLGVTIADGLGFNRAIFLEYCSKTNILKGKIALGPLNKKVASEMCEQIAAARLSLDVCLDEYKNKGLPDKELNRVVKEIEILLDNNSDDFSKCIIGKNMKEVENMPWPYDFIRKLDMDSLRIVMIPIICRKECVEEVLGILIVDNIYSEVGSSGSQKILKGDLQLLKVFADRVAMTIKTIKKIIEDGKVITETKIQLQNDLDERERIGRIGIMIAKQLDLDYVLRHIMTESLRLAGSQRGSIMLYDDESDRLNLEWGEKLPELRKSMKLNGDAFSQAITTRESVRISDFNLETEKRLRTDVNVRSRLIVPLKIGDKVTGVLSVDDAEPQKYTIVHQRKLQILADYAAIAIRNAQLYKETDSVRARKVKELATLYEIGTKITSQVDLEVVLKSIIDNALNIIEDDLNLGIFLYASREDELVLEASHGSEVSPPLPNGAKYSIPVIGIDGKSLVARAFRENKTIYVENVSGESSYLPVTDDIGSELDIPLTYNNRPIGVLNAESVKKNGFNPAMIELFTNFASQAAIAINNAQILRDHTETNQKLQTILQLFKHQIIKHPQNIRLACELLRDYDNLSEDVRREQLSSLHASAFLITNCIDNINIWHKIAYPYQPQQLAKEKVNLSSEIELMTRSLLFARKEKNISFDTNIAENINAFYTNSTYVRIILINLLDNAVKFGAKNGLIRIGGQKTNHALIITIEDDGIGIPNEEIHKIFDMFYRATNVTKKQYDGIGAGLFVVAELCKFLEWQVDCKSPTDGKRGTCFSITMPNHSIKDGG